MKTGLVIFLVGILIAAVCGIGYAQTDDKHKFDQFAGKKAEAFPAWSSSGSIGYNATGGYIDTQSLVGDFILTHDRQWTSHILKSGIAYGNVTYPQGDAVLNVNKYYGNYKLEAYIYQNRKPYFWGLGGADSDQFQGYWGKYAAEAGFGYSFFGISDYVLKAEIGYAFVDTNWINKTEIDNGELHYWDPTHNGLVRLIASVPIVKMVLFTEEASYRHNFQDQDDYVVDSTSGLNFRLTAKLSFKTGFKINYTNMPGLVEALDETGKVIVYDNDRDPATPDVAMLRPTDRTSYGWTNALVISFF